MIDHLLPYRDLKVDKPDNVGDDYLVKFQARVSHNDKQLLMTIVPDTGIFTLLCRFAVKQTADYVRSNNLTYSPESTRLLLAFICGGPFTRPTGDVGVRHDNRASTPVLDSSTSSSDQPSHVHESSESRPAKENRKTKIKRAVQRTKRPRPE